MGVPTWHQLRKFQAQAVELGFRTKQGETWNTGSKRLAVKLIGKDYTGMLPWDYKAVSGYIKQAQKLIDSGTNPSAGVVRRLAKCEPSGEAKAPPSSDPRGCT